MQSAGMIWINPGWRWLTSDASCARDSADCVSPPRTLPILVIRERGGSTLPGVFRSEAEALTFIRTRRAPKTTLYADEAGAWNDLHARFELHRINHQEA
jgi:hypothetical protein